MRRRRLLFALGAGVGLAGCGGNGGESGGADADDGTDAATRTDSPSATSGASSSATLSVSTPAFEEGGAVPTEYTCEGENVSPRLNLGGVPSDASSLAVVVDDPDAPTDRPFVHWLLWNVPPDRTTLPRAVPRGETVSALDGARQGTNGAGSVGYTGPCPPPSDGAHTYRFTAVALDATLSLAAGAKRPAVDDALDGHVLARGRLTATFDRRAEKRDS